ncbi:hypothetical protein ACWY4P_40565 [Streptomyces sp. LZ34]
MPDLLVQIDDKTLPLAACFWVRFDANGCATGSVRPTSALRTLATAEQAQEWAIPHKRDRDRENKQGVRYELLTHKQWDTQAKPCLLGKCKHGKQAAS